MIEPSRHILSSFDENLELMREKLLAVAILTNEIVKAALNEGNQECANAIANDTRIDQLEKEIDQLGFVILVRFHPVAGDLRQVISTMRTSQNLERIADHAVGIAQKVKKISIFSYSAEAASLQPLYKEAITLLRDAIIAFTNEDTVLAQSLKQRDGRIDELHSEISEELTQLMSEYPGRISVYLTLIFIARHIAGIADIAKYIGEDTVFATSALDIRNSSWTEPFC